MREHVKQERNNITVIQSHDGIARVWCIPFTTSKEICAREKGSCLVFPALAINNIIQCELLIHTKCHVKHNT